MAGELKIGAVLDWDAFEFPGRDSKDKLLVVLGARPGSDYLLALTTSRRKGKALDPGCHADAGYYVLQGGGKDFFNVDTWVLISDPHTTRAAELVKLAMAQKVRVLGNLRVDVANAIRNCLRRCPDVAKVHADLL